MGYSIGGTGRDLKTLVCSNTNNWDRLGDLLWAIGRVADVRGQGCSRRGIGNGTRRQMGGRGYYSLMLSAPELTWPCAAKRCPVAPVD